MMGRWSVFSWLVIFLYSHTAFCFLSSKIQPYSHIPSISEIPYVNHHLRTRISLILSPNIIHRNRFARIHDTNDHDISDHQNHNEHVDSDRKSDRNSIGASFIESKNIILLERLRNPKDGNLTATAIEYVNLCDESFDQFLTKQMNDASSETQRQKLGRIRYEVNSARRFMLIEADKILRNILSAGGLKQMEAKLSYYLRRAEIDMAFMVILQLNIEDAINANVTTAVQVMKHLETLITEFQDSFVSPPVRLLRMLLRADDIVIRKQMLRQKLLYLTPGGEYLSSGEIEARARSLNPSMTIATGSACSTEMTTNDTPLNNPSSEPQQSMLPTPSAQCENILVDAVKSWGKADVTFKELEDTIGDVLAQMTTIGGHTLSKADLELKCSYLLEEIEEVNQEFSLFFSRIQANMTINESKKNDANNSNNIEENPLIPMDADV